MINRNSGCLRLLSGALVVACCALHLTAVPAVAAPVQLTVTGSTLLIPLFKLWIPDYIASHPDVMITTNASGSGAGIDAAISGTAEIGVSDAYYVR
jgi:phosphate transport system substrate-binding protein